jgi:hypothetical protein
MVVSARVKQRSVTIPAPSGLDWKAVGYLTSIASVFFLGAVAWPKENAPSWYYPALVIGMATSILGMGFRYLAHLKQKREIRKAEADAERR